jgi:predicted DCC family thiol-disulfide oxidoreductase YuxK
MTELLVWFDSHCPFCQREIALMRPFGLMARNRLVLAVLEQASMAFLRRRPRLQRSARRLA